jgi:tRNA pseudouridine38-40 synthase
MKTWKITLEYDGTKYSGWQEQKNSRTIQGEMKKAAEDCLGGKVEIGGSGRTDAGVHALGQVAHLKIEPRRATKKIPHSQELIYALNDRLPQDICVLGVEDASPQFHARHDAVSRTYLYQISRRRTAFGKKYVWWVRDKLDVEAMSKAAELLVGRHDFLTFSRRDSSRENDSTIVVVQSTEIQIADHLILFRITASHFLWNMVRRIAGSLVEAGRHHITVGDFGDFIKDPGRKSADVALWTAPPSGLFLEQVLYASDQREHQARKQPIRKKW